MTETNVIIMGDQPDPTMSKLKAYMNPKGIEFLEEQIPERMQGGIARWIVKGIRPGHFLSAVIANNLKDAVGRADDENVAILQRYVVFFYNYAPNACWGDPDKLIEWKGLEEKNDA